MGKSETKKTSKKKEMIALLKQNAAMMAMMKDMMAENKRLQKKADRREKKLIKQNEALQTKLKDLKVTVRQTKKRSLKPKKKTEIKAVPEVTPMKRELGKKTAEKIIDDLQLSKKRTRKKTKTKPDPPTAADKKLEEDLPGVKKLSSKETLVNIGKRKAFHYVFNNKNYRQKDATEGILKALQRSMKTVGDGYTYRLVFDDQRDKGTKAIPYNESIANGSLKIIPPEMLVIKEYDEYYLVDKTTHLEDVVTAGNFDKVIVVFEPIVHNAGGADKDNDCLATLLGIDPMELKEFLELPRNALIPVERMKDIEDKYNLNIHIQNRYAGQFKSGRECVKLRLVDDHYQLAPDLEYQQPLPYRELPKEADTKNLNFLMYRRNGKMFDTFTKKWNPDTKQEDDMHREMDFGTIHHLSGWGKDAPAPKFRSWEIADKRADLKTEYERAVECEKAVFLITRSWYKKKGIEGGYYISRHHTNMNSAILTFFQFTLSPAKKREFVGIHPYTDTLCEQAFHGGIIWANPGEYENMTELDYKAFYHSIYKTMKLPYSRGKFYNSVLYKDKSPLPFGLYQVNITKEECRKEKPHRFIHAKVYSHIEIEDMCKHEYEHEIHGLCEIWAESSLLDIMKPFAKEFENLRDKYPHTKKFCNTLWGLLTQKNTSYYTVDIGGSTPALYVHNLTKDENKVYVQGIKQDGNHFKLQPHFGAFITSMARHRINEAMDKVGRENIVRVHTDGFYTSQVPKNITGTNIGDLVEQKKGTVHIHHVNHCLWNDQITNPVEQAQESEEIKLLPGMYINCIN